MRTSEYRDAMKHMRRLIGLTALLFLPVSHAGTVSAAQVSVTQELHVTAVVPMHRDIVLDRNGTITRITSNTTEDVLPTVYRSSIDPANQIELSDRLYQQYRKHVPEGTAKYGILYEDTSIIALISLRSSLDS